MSAGRRRSGADEDGREIDRDDKLDREGELARFDALDRDDELDRDGALDRDGELARFDDACEAYLEKRLTAAATRAFERALVVPARAQRFREALLMRELLGSIGPDAPAGLARQIQARLREARAADGRQGAEAEGGRLHGGWRAALDGLAWTLRGPSLAFTAQPSAPSGTAPVLQGLGTLRNAVPGLSQEPAPEARPRRRSLVWRLLRGRKS